MRKKQQTKVIINQVNAGGLLFSGVVPQQMQSLFAPAAADNRLNTAGDSISPLQTPELNKPSVEFWDVFGMRKKVF